MELRNLTENEISSLIVKEETKRHISGTELGYRVTGFMKCIKEMNINPNTILTLNQKEIEKICLRDNKSHISGTRLGGMVSGFKLCMRKI